MPKWTRGGERAASREGVVVDARPFELHGTRYFAVLFTLDDEDGRAREARLSYDMIYEEPRAGDRVLVDLVLGVVDRMRKQEAAADSSAAP